MNTELKESNMAKINFLLRYSLSMLYYFVFWIGAYYLFDIFFGNKILDLNRLLWSLFFAITLTYFTDGGALFKKLTKVK